MEPQQNHRRVVVLTETVNSNQGSWKQPFNQATFMNYDINAGVQINTDIYVPKATQDPVTLEIYPTNFEISLNVNEVNDTNYNFNFFGSTTAKLVIVHTEYNEGL
jgi:hypothetical protein